MALPEPIPLKSMTLHKTHRKQSRQRRLNLPSHKPSRPSARARRCVVLRIKPLDDPRRVSYYSLQLGKLDTAMAGNSPADEESNPQSVIHAPPQFKQFVRNTN